MTDVAGFHHAAAGDLVNIFERLSFEEDSALATAYRESFMSA